MKAGTIFLLLLLTLACQAPPRPQVRQIEPVGLELGHGKSAVSVNGNNLPPGAPAGEYRETVFQGITFEVYVTAPARVELYWKDPKTGMPIRRLSRIQKLADDAGRKVVFAMNAGIFEPAGVPNGLHVEKGEPLHPLNLAEGDGNFFLLPNGVFVISRDGKASILESHEYARAGIEPWLAIQSGPLLLSRGVIHPKFRRDSSNRRHRNAVGVNKDGQVVFVCTKAGQEKYATLYELAEFFRELGCRDALFLDGDLSTMVVSPEGQVADKNDFGAILAITEDISSQPSAPPTRDAADASPR